MQKVIHGIAALMYWQKAFARYRRQCVIALVVSVGFLIADVAYPTEDTKSSNVVYDGKYSDFPCEKGQFVSPTDHRPCKPLAAATEVKPVLRRFNAAVFNTEATVHEAYFVPRQ